MKGEWRQVGKLVYDLGSEIGEALDSEEADNFARSHNAALRAAVEEERKRCAEIASEFAFSAEIVDSIRARGGGA